MVPTTIVLTVVSLAIFLYQQSQNTCLQVRESFVPAACTTITDTTTGFAPVRSDQLFKQIPITYTYIHTHSHAIALYSHPYSLKLTPHILIHTFTRS